MVGWLLCIEVNSYQLNSFSKGNVHINYSQAKEIKQVPKSINPFNDGSC
jgi:hypothetical protein